MQYFFELSHFVLTYYHMRFDEKFVVLNKEAKELQEILKNNEKARQAYAEFEAECKLRKARTMTQKELKKKFFV